MTREFDEQVREARKNNDYPYLYGTLLGHLEVIKQILENAMELDDPEELKKEVIRRVERIGEILEVHQK